MPNQPYKFYIPPAIVSLTFILLLFIYSLKSSVMLADPDFWWHLKAGEAISMLGHIPKHDVFSFSMENAGYPWLNVSWLWDYSYYLLYSVSGLYLPVVATVIINAFTVSALVWFRACAGNKSYHVVIFTCFHNCSLQLSRYGRARTK